MFSHMEATFLWGVALTVIAFAVAAGSEGRLRHALKILLGMAPRTENFNLYDDVERPDYEWDVVGRIVDPRVRTGELPVRVITFRDVGHQAAVSQLLAVMEEAEPPRAPAVMPPSIEPRKERRRQLESAPASR